MATRLGDAVINVKLDTSSAQAQIQKLKKEASGIQKDAESSRSKIQSSAKIQESSITSILNARKRASAGSDFTNALGNVRRGAGAASRLGIPGAARVGGAASSVLGLSRALGPIGLVIAAGVAAAESVPYVSGIAEAVGATGLSREVLNPIQDAINSLKKELNSLKNSVVTIIDPLANVRDLGVSAAMLGRKLDLGQVSKFNWAGKKWKDKEYEVQLAQEQIETEAATFQRSHLYLTAAGRTIDVIKAAFSGGSKR